MKKFLSIALVLIFAVTIVWAGSKPGTGSGTVVDKISSQPASTSANSGNAKAAAAKAQTGKNKTADIKTLLALTKAGELAAQMMQELIQNYRQNLPQVPDAFWLGFARKVNTEELVNMLVPIYDRHLTGSDIAALIEFFQSPAGQKLVSVQPEIMKESMQAGREWGMKLGSEVAAELQKQGYH